MKTSTLDKLKALKNRESASKNKESSDFFDLSLMSPKDKTDKKHDITVFRVLPDYVNGNMNDDNENVYYTEFSTHRMTVGVNDKNQQINEYVECWHNYGDYECPICRKKDEVYKTGDVDTGRKLLRTTFTIIRAVLVSTPFNMDNLSEAECETAPATYKYQAGDIVTLRLPTSIAKILKSQVLEFAEGEFQYEDKLQYKTAPQLSQIDFDDGCNFVVRKTFKDGRPNYDASGFTVESNPIVVDESLLQESLQDILKRQLKGKPTIETMNNVLAKFEEFHFGVKVSEPSQLAREKAESVRQGLGGLKAQLANKVQSTQQSHNVQHVPNPNLDDTTSGDDVPW